MKLKLDQEINGKRNVEILQKYYMDSLPLLQANFYSTLIEGRIRKEELGKYLSDYQIAFEGPFFCCLVIHTSSRKIPKDMNPMLLSTSVQRQAEERLGCLLYTSCWPEQRRYGSSILIVIVGIWCPVPCMSLQQKAQIRCSSFFPLYPVR